MNEFEKKNKVQWSKVLNELFPKGIPENAIWTNQDQIMKVLNHLGAIDNLNHTFLPSGGGLDLEIAKESKETGCIELQLDGLDHVVKAVSLTFVNVEDDFHWAYFTLDTSGLAPTGVYNRIHKGQEPLCELASGEYKAVGEYERYGDDGERYHEGSRIVSRFTEGRFLIVAKSSVYNAIPATYDGRHNEMTQTEFRDYMISMREGALAANIEE